mgnify:CR=1 FL=1
MKKAIVSIQCRLGIPLALQHVLIAVGGMILQSAINKHGFLFIAGFTATNKIYGLLESSAVSLAMPLPPIWPRTTAPASADGFAKA